jgi:hypothetical protein
VKQEKTVFVVTGDRVLASLKEHAYTCSVKLITNKLGKIYFIGVHIFSNLVCDFSKYGTAELLNWLTLRSADVDINHKSR